MYYLQILLKLFLEPITDASPNKMFSIELSLCDALKAHCKAIDRPMSGVVEQGIRLVLALPPEVEAEDSEAVGMVRSEREMLECMMKKDPRDWYDSRAITKEMGHSHNLNEGALKALARQGKVFLYGDWWGDGESACGTCWGLRPAMDLVNDAIALWRAKGVPLHDNPSLFTPYFNYIAKIGISMSNVAEARAAVDAVMGAGLALDMGLENFAERHARKRAAYEAKHAAEQARYEEDCRQRRAGETAHDAEQKRLDAEYRRQVEADRIKTVDAEAPEQIKGKPFRTTDIT